MSNKKFYKTIDGIIVSGFVDLIYEPEEDSRILAELACNDIKNRFHNVPIRVLDIGTGCGFIALDIRKNTGSVVCGIDIDPLAIDIARNNAVVNNLLDGVVFGLSDLFENLDEGNITFDYFVGSIPCYTEEQYNDELKKHPEYKLLPKAAYVSKNGPEYFYAEIGKNAAKFLNKDGIILLLVPLAGQPKEISDLLSQYGLETIGIYRTRYIMCKYNPDLIKEK